MWYKEALVMICKLVLDGEIEDVPSFLNQMLKDWEKLEKEYENLPRPQYIK